MKRIAVMLMVGLGLGSCQLVTVPRDACFVGETCAHGDGGPGGGSVGAGGGGGGGQGGGGQGGGVIDAGPDVADLFRDAGICEDWACVAQKLAAPGLVPPVFQEIDVPVAGAAPPSPSCGPNWSGGVLLPDGRVLAMPACADHFLLIDVASRRADLVGPQLNMIGAPLFFSGVLGCDERVYAMPAFQSEIARITVTPGTLNVEVAFFDLGVELKMKGAVVAQPCDPALVIAGLGQDPSGLNAVAQRIHIRENGAELSTFPVARVGGILGGAVRLGDDSVWLGAASANGAGRHFFTRFQPRDGGVATLPATDPVNGYDIFPAGLAVSGAGGAVFIEDSTTAFELVADAGAPLGFSVAELESDISFEPHVRWPAARGDGFIYTSGAAVIAISDRDGGHTVLFDQLFDGGSANAMEGLVVTFDGSLVGIPGSDSTVRLFVSQTGGGLVAPPEVLLSPFFNKL